MMIRSFLSLALASAVVLPARGANESNFNYAEALQKSLYFFEAQQSGKLRQTTAFHGAATPALPTGRILARI
jgi:hypothetical protein